MKRVLVTGATTPLGTALVGALAGDAGVEQVLAVAAEPAPSVPFSTDRVTYVRADLARSRDRRTLLFGMARDLAIDSVVHLAMHRAADAAGSRVRALNVDSLRELLHLVERHPTIRNVVYRGHAEVYRLREDAPSVIDEEDALDLPRTAPQWLRDRVEADQVACAHIGSACARIVVLRCAEVFAPESGSQLFDYVRSKVCLRPLGYDPMVQLLSVDDAVAALILALRSDARGVFNIPGADTLPLSELVRLCGRTSIPLPGPVLAPLYRLRALALGTQFRYDLNVGRLHFNCVLDGERARRVLGYVPSHRLKWPGISAHGGRFAPIADGPDGPHGSSGVRTRTTSSGQRSIIAE